MWCLPWGREKKKNDDNNNDDSDEEEDADNVLDGDAEDDTMPEPEREDEVQVHDDDVEDKKEEEKDADDGSEATIVGWFPHWHLTTNETHLCSKNWERTSKATESFATASAHTTSW